MPTNRVEAAFSPLYLTLGAAALAGSSDVELLRRFTAGGGMGEAAFAALVQRHGPSVMRVCRCVLRHTQDAEDAFQATFLVLAAKANSLSLRGPLALWLHAVARRVALQARAAAERRRRHERRAAKSEAAPVETPPPDLAAEVLESVGRLPERFRTAVILCDLEGLTYAEAAERLGWTHATVRNRLARGRDRLRAALARKGRAPVTALAAGAVSPVSRALAAATVRAAVGVAAGAACEGVPASVMVLVSGGLRAMLLTKLQTVGLTVLVAAAVVAGAHGLTARGPGEQTEQTRPAPETPAAAPTGHPPVTAQSQPATAPADQLATRLHIPVEELVAKLAIPVSIDKAIEAILLKDMLSFLSERYHVTFILDTKAFGDAGCPNVEDALVRLPKLPGISLRTVLRLVLAQLPIQGTFFVRNDHVELVPFDKVLSEAYGLLVPLQAPQPRMIQPLVNVACLRQSLVSVLADVAQQSGRNVVLDPRVTDPDKRLVTLTLLNAPTDTAVRVLAELANLKAVQWDNVFFVTTPEVAAELRREGGHPAGVPPPGPPPGMDGPLPTPPKGPPPPP